MPAVADFRTDWVVAGTSKRFGNVMVRLLRNGLEGELPETVTRLGDGLNTEVVSLVWYAMSANPSTDVDRRWLTASRRDLFSGVTPRCLASPVGPEVESGRSLFHRPTFPLRAAISTSR